MFKLVVFVPLENKEDVKKAIFNSGAGCIGNYSECCFEVEGIGQFKPLSGSNPTIGECDQIQKVSEVRIEVLCTKDNVKDAIKNMIKAHPYEEVAYEVYPIFTLETLD